jgi:HSP20 family protein
MNTISQKIPVRLFQSDSRLMLVTPMPGIKPSDISVTIEGRTVKISGQQTGPGQDEKDLIMEEWQMGPYYRDIQLPEAVNGPLTNATFGNGVLILAMPKAGEETHRSITFHLEAIDAARGGRIAHQGAEIKPTT